MPIASPGESLLAIQSLQTELGKKWPWKGLERVVEGHD